MKKTSLLLFFALFCFFLITYNQNEKLNYSFYHWENSFKEKNSDKKKYYIKILDISYSNKLELIKTRIQTSLPKKFVPVIYISNETLKNIKYDKLSKIIIQKIKTFNFSYEELQIDSDWTISTKYNYFELLKTLKIKLNKILSATIRLHQIKYYMKTDIPPVDYGVLMYYNMSDIRKFETKNSILDNDIAKKYHYNFDTYKLKLKLALPLYSQAIWFRQKNALEIFEGLKESDFNENFKKLSNNKYKVLKNFYFKGRYIYKNDVFRFEDSSYEDLKTALKDFLKLSKNRFNEVIFYTSKYKDKYNLNELLKENQ